MSEYRAFISYNHKDRRFVKGLLERLERFVLAKPLREAAGLVPEAKGRIGRIFCDREEFAAGGNLSQAVQDALAKSQALIVVCSKTARESKWVNAEITMFRSLHPDRPILCAIVPDASDDAVFPHALTIEGVEPLAADFRHNKDGRRLGLLKLIAGLLSISLDSLVQRDAQRRQKVVITVTCLMTLIALIMAVLAVQAITARQAAERQRQAAIEARQDAEELVGFMLGELRESVEELGRIDVLEGVGTQVLTYYQGFEGQSLGDEQLEFFADALRLSGDAAYRAGQLESARVQFDAAAEVTLEQLQRAPNNGDRIYAHAQSVFWLAALARREGDLEEAQAYFENYYELAVRLVEIDPNRLDWRLELAYGASNVGTILYDQGQFRAAQPYFETSGEELAIIVTGYQREGNEAAFSSAMRDLATTFAWRADAAYSLDRMDEALEMRCSQAAIYDELNQTSMIDDWRLKANEFSSSKAIVHILESQGRHQLALNVLLSAESLIVALREHEPSEVRWAMQDYAYQLRLLSLYVELGDKMNADQAYSRLSQVKSELSNIPEESPEMQRRLDDEQSVVQRYRAMQYGQVSIMNEIDSTDVCELNAHGE